jgi:hypothetical protein
MRASGVRVRASTNAPDKASLGPVDKGAVEGATVRDAVSRAQSGRRVPKRTPQISL